MRGAWPAAMRWLLPLVLVACSSPYKNAGGDDDPGDTSNVPLRDCATTFSFRAAPGVTSVAVAGDWDWTTKEPMTLAGDTWTLAKELSPGVHAYKLIVNE